jgi:hypothetical protein
MYVLKYHWDHLPQEQCIVLEYTFMLYWCIQIGIQRRSRSVAQYWNLLLNISIFYLFQWIKYVVESLYIHVSETFCLFNCCYCHDILSGSADQHKLVQALRLCILLFNHIYYVRPNVVKYSCATKLLFLSPIRYLYYTVSEIRCSVPVISL